MTNCILDRGAGLQHFLVITSGAGDAGFPRTLLVRVGVLSARLTHRVVVRLTAEQHALPFRTFSAKFTPLRELVQVVTIVAHTDGIVGVRAGRLHAEQACALCAQLTFLCVAEVL